MPRQLYNLRVQIREEYEKLVRELSPYSKKNPVFMNALKGFGVACIKGIGEHVPGALEGVELSILNNKPIEQLDIDIMKAAEESFETTCNSYNASSILEAAGEDAKLSVKKISELLKAYEEVERYYMQVQREFPQASMDEIDSRVDSFYGSINNIRYDGSAQMANYYADELYAVDNSYDSTLPSQEEVEKAEQAEQEPDLPGRNELEEAGQADPDMDLPGRDELEEAGQADPDMDLPGQDEVEKASAAPGNPKPKKAITNNLEKERLMLNDEFSKLLSVLNSKAEEPDEKNALQFFTQFMEKNISGYNDRDGHHVDGLFARIAKALEDNIYPTDDDINACKEAIKEFNSHCRRDKSKKDIDPNEAKLLAKAGYDAQFISGYISDLLDGFVNLANDFNETKGFYPDNDIHDIEKIMGLDSAVAGVVKDYHLKENDPVKFIRAQLHFVNERTQGTSLVTYVHEATRYFNNMYDTAPPEMNDGLVALGNALNNFIVALDDVVYNKEALEQADFDRLDKEISMLLFVRGKYPQLSDFHKIHVFDALIQKIDDQYNMYRSYVTKECPQINIREFASNEKDYVVHCVFDEIFEQDARIYKNFLAAEEKRKKAEIDQPKVDTGKSKTAADNSEGADHSSTDKTRISFAEWSSNAYASIQKQMEQFAKYPGYMKKSNKGFTKQSEEFKQFTLRAGKLVDRYNQLREALKSEDEAGQKKAWERFLKQMVNAKIDAQNYKYHCERISRKNSSVRQQRVSLTGTIENSLNDMIDAIDGSSPDVKFKEQFDAIFKKHEKTRSDDKLKNIPKVKSREIKLDHQEKPKDSPVAGL